MKISALRISLAIMAWAGWLATPLWAADTPRHIPISLNSDDVIATGNDWIALPTIRAVDGALVNFNVLSMRDRGLLQVDGEHGAPALEPYFVVDGKRLQFHNPSWELIEYWIPVAHLTSSGLDASITYCAPPSAHGAFIAMKLTNHTRKTVAVGLGLKASWGSLSRVTYNPVVLRGNRAIVGAPWEKAAQDFTFVTSDTYFAWSIYYPGAEGKLSAPPLSVSPALDAQRTVDSLAPGETAEARFVLGVGLEEYSASQAANVLDNSIDRNGVDAVVGQTAAWCRSRTRTTGQADLDLLMNRNFLFTSLYAWGRSIDTEQLAGVTSRSPRYYVSAAYWDRDAMLWSFPGLLDSDPRRARDALEYALTTQLRNVGTHSRFIDGVILEDGFELDEAAAPLVATSQYIERTQDDAFFMQHKDALMKVYDVISAHLDADTGLYWTLQDAQDQYRKQQFNTYNNVLVWRTMLDFAALLERFKDPAKARELRQRADLLRAAIMKHNVSSGAPGASGTIFVSATDVSATDVSAADVSATDVSATDGKTPIFADVPPGSLMKLPSLGFVTETDPVFVRTYEWLHSKDYQYSYSDQPYGLPGSYRLPFTTPWEVADHLSLKAGREQALKILRASHWDGGIISEGVDPASAVMDYDGRAFATAAGYIAHAICHSFCVDSSK